MRRCRETETLLNELLDARGRTPAGLVEAIESHAAECLACAQIVARYRTLGRAIEALSIATVAPTMAFADRPRPVPSTIAMPRRRWAAPFRIAAAAGLLAAGVIAVREAARPPEAPPASPGRSLADSFADATTATIELARETSAPAGRVGRVVLASAGLSTDADPPARLQAPAGVSTSDVLQSVGDRVGAGVRPLSGSARQAFAFLIPGGTPLPPPPPGS